MDVITITPSITGFMFSIQKREGPSLMFDLTDIESSGLITNVAKDEEGVEIKEFGFFVALTGNISIRFDGFMDEQSQIEAFEHFNKTVRAARKAELQFREETHDQ